MTKSATAASVHGAVPEEIAGRERSRSDQVHWRGGTDVHRLRRDRDSSLEAGGGRLLARVTLGAVRRKRPGGGAEAAGKGRHRGGARGQVQVGPHVPVASRQRQAGDVEWGGGRHGDGRSDGDQAGQDLADKARRNRDAAGLAAEDRGLDGWNNLNDAGGIGDELIAVDVGGIVGSGRGGDDAGRPGENHVLGSGCRQRNRSAGALVGPLGIDEAKRGVLCFQRPNDRVRPELVVGSHILP